MAREGPEDSATFADLQEFFGLPGCAVCRCRAQSAARFLETLLYERVTVPATEVRLRASNGFCGRHLDGLLDRRAPLATALLYRPLLAERRALLAGWRAGPRKAARGFRPTDPRVVAIGLACPACEAEREGERRAVEVLAVGLDSGALRKGWAASAGLCWPHFVSVRARARGGRPALDEVQAERLASLAQDVQGFVDSFDYRSTAPRTARQEASWRRVAAVVAGPHLRNRTAQSPPTGAAGAALPGADRADGPGQRGRG